MLKKVIGLIKLQIPSGKASPSPPIGPTLGQRGLNIMDFCKEFNAKTKDMESGFPLPVVITVFSDRKFSFLIKKPTATSLIKKEAKLEKGSSKPNMYKIGKITRKQLESIAQIKITDMTASSLQAAINTIEGSARSMGITIVS